MTITSAPVDGFAAQIRAASSAAHDGAEHAAFMDALSAGRLGPDAATAFLTQLLFVYEALEEAGEAHRHDAVAGRFVFDELVRVPSLRADLAATLGPQWRDEVTPYASTGAYVERLRTTAIASPGAYVAHAYTRYLGDLSGGRAIRRWLQTALGATDGTGTTFYVFEGVASPAAFKNEYRARLDAVPWDASERAAVIDEVLLAYRLNTALLRELGEQVPAWERVEVADARDETVRA